MNTMSAAQRYHRDPMFATLVDTMRRLIRELQMTPTEIREAAIFAAVIEERQMTQCWIQELDHFTQQIIKEQKLREPEVPRT